MESPSSTERLNALPLAEAERELLKCCGSKNWARRTADNRPFQSAKELLADAERIWWSLEPHDWLEAFRSHPRIGESKGAQSASAEERAWAREEQSRARNAAPDTLHALTELNRTYEEKFGYIYIICATGKTSEEMLAVLRERLRNDPDKELPVAAGEQAKITQLRLEKLIDSF